MDKWKKSIQTRLKYSYIILSPNSTILSVTHVLYFIFISTQTKWMDNSINQANYSSEWSTGEMCGWMHTHIYTCPTSHFRGQAPVGMLLILCFLNIPSPLSFISDFNFCGMTVCLWTVWNLLTLKLDCPDLNFISFTYYQWDHGKNCLIIHFLIFKIKIIKITCT